MVPVSYDHLGIRSNETEKLDESFSANTARTTFPIAITFCYRRDRITIYKSVVTALGDPDHIRMLINPEEKVLIAQVCDQEERNAIKVPHNLRKDGVPFAIHSKALLESMTKLMGWLKHLTYRVRGEMQVESGLLVFMLEKAEIVNESDGGETIVS